MTSSNPTQLPNYTYDQMYYFYGLCQKVHANEMTMNQAYKSAQGYQNMEGDGGFKGSFNMWLQTAIDQGWAAQGSQIATGAKQNYSESGSILGNPSPDGKPKNNTFLWGVIITSVVVSGFLIYKHYKKTN